MSTSEPSRPLIFVQLAVAAVCGAVALADALLFAPLHLWVVGVSALLGTVTAVMAMKRAAAAGDLKLKLAATALVGFLGVPLLGVAVIGTMLLFHRLQ